MTSHPSLATAGCCFPTLRGQTCRMTDRQRGRPGQQRAHRPWTEWHSDGVVLVALGLRDIYPTSLKDKDHSQEREHLIGWGSCHSLSDSEVSMQCCNCSVYMSVAKRVKSASYWLEGNVNHKHCQIRHHSFLNDVTAAQWQSPFSASSVCACLCVF